MDLTLATTEIPVDLSSSDTEALRSPLLSSADDLNTFPTYRKVSVDSLSYHLRRGFDSADLNLSIRCTDDDDCSTLDQSTHPTSSTGRHTRSRSSHVAPIRLFMSMDSRDPQVVEPSEETSEYSDEDIIFTRGELDVGTTIQEGGVTRSFASLQEIEVGIANPTTESVVSNLEDISFDPESCENPARGPQMKKDIQQMVLTGQTSADWVKLQELDVSNRLNANFEISSLPSNSHCNRYCFLLALESTRVILPSQQYIHANWVDCIDLIKALSKGAIEPAKLPILPIQKCIATQAPLSHTVAHFWEMIESTNCHAVVCLTRMRERGNIKCFRYWPRKKYVPLVLPNDKVITLHSVEKYPALGLRVNALSLGSENYPITLFELLSWPDHNVPDNVDAIVFLLERLVRLQLSYENGNGWPPVTIHCSAGVGRAGTFIILLLLYTMCRIGVKIDGIPDIATTVTKLRSYRDHAITELSQYEFVYEFMLYLLDRKGKTGN